MVCKTVRGAMRKVLADDGRKNKFFDSEDDGDDDC
jgi:hypothetical protein